METKLGITAQRATDLANSCEKRLQDELHVAKMQIENAAMRGESNVQLQFTPSSALTEKITEQIEKAGFNVRINETYMLVSWPVND